MPPTSKMPVAKKVVKKTTPAKSTRPLLQLPTEPSEPAHSLRDYITMVFGPTGVGKSTFVNQFGRVLFLSTDRGTRFMSAMRQECLDWEAFEAAMDALEASSADAYDYIAIDHVDDWANFAETHILQKLNIEALTDAGYGKGWSLLKKELHRYLARLKALNLGIVFIAHEESKKVKVRGLDVDKVMPLMSKQAWNAIIPLVDIVGYSSVTPVRGPDGKRKEVRTIDTTPRDDLYAKDRISHLRKKPQGVELLDGAKFIATFAQ